jgi:hypothetical protein
MADKKISELTAATTPLAGTEVLPIVQGGSTVKVSIADVTAGRGISATSVTNGLGAVGTPSYTFTGDTNTGVWSPAADVVAVSTNGVQRLRANNTGVLVGSGGTPVGQLSVEGSAANEAAALGTPDNASTTITNSANSASNQKASVILRSNSSSAAVVASYFESFFGAGDTATGLLLATQPNLAGGVVERVRITAAGRVGVNTSTPNAASIMDVTSTTGGFLPPRMTGAQRDAIAAPPNGLMLYNSTTDKLQVRAAGSWVDLH